MAGEALAVAVQLALFVRDNTVAVLDLPAKRRVRGEVRVCPVAFVPYLLAPSRLRPMGMAGGLRDRQRDKVLDGGVAVAGKFLLAQIVEDRLGFRQVALNDSADGGG